MEEEMRSESVAEAGGRHWSVRPWALFTFVLAAKTLISIFTRIVALLSTNPNQSQSPDFGFILAVSSAVPIFALAAVAACYVSVRRTQRKHGLQVEAEWTATKVLWAGVALFAVYAAIVLLQDVNEYEPIGFIAMNLATGLVGSLSTVLLYFLLLPVAEVRYGLVKSALITGAMVVLLAVLDRLISVSLIYVQATAMHMQTNTDGIVSITTLRSIVSGFASGVLAVVAYRLASRKLPGAWALYAALGGLTGRFFLMISNPLRSGPSKNLALYYVVYLLNYLVITLLSLGVLAGYKKWSSFQAFAADLRQGVLKLRGMQDDGET